MLVNDLTITLSAVSFDDNYGSCTVTPPRLSFFIFRDNLTKNREAKMPGIRRRIDLKLNPKSTAPDRCSKFKHRGSRSAAEYFGG